MTNDRLALLSCIVFACSLTLAASPPQLPARLVLTDDSAELENALASRTPPHSLPVRVAALSLPADDPAVVRLLLVASIDDAREGLPLTSVAYWLITEQGERRTGALRRKDLRPTGPNTLSFVEVVSVPPGTYRFRLAAMRTGRLGVAEAGVVARVQPAASIRLGDLLVGEVSGSEAMENVTPERRVHGDRVVVTLPIGVDRATASDVAMLLDVVKDAAGAAMVSEPLSLIPGEGSSRLAQAVADTRVLPPGDYVARVNVAVAGKEVARVLAPFAIDRASSAAAASPPAGAASVATGAASAFRLQDVLDAAVLGPFLDELAALAPDRAKPAIDRAKAGRFAEATQEAASNDPKDPVHPFLEGLSLLSNKQLQAASDAFRETLRASPDYFVGAFYIGACYAAGGKDAEAVNAWQTSLIGLDEYPIVFRLLGEAFMRMGQPDRAVQTLEEASAKWPDDAALRLRLARAALDARKYDRVTAAVDAGLAHPRPDPDLLLVGMQAIFEQVTRQAGPPPDDALSRIKRYDEAYVAAGGARQPLVNEWVAALEKKLSAGKDQSHS